MSGSQLTFVLIVRLPQIAAVIGSILLAYYSKPGWGWMIFLAVLLDTSVKIRSE
ncbi:MAG: hypothetical protein E6868_08175 [Pantoea sp.]|uniref:hypothetical protein n=1 Tax=Pantoea sp. TaxID=69393 RepID=UPI002901B475|nr:hypothetical protein [Pantoea sp.]MDU1573212.1 hypothetical protein [Pantoea sp.]